jgi:hypothetical protein
MRLRKFQDFVDSDFFNRSEWVKEFGVRIYVRKPVSALHSADFEIANIEADNPGRGNLTKFLNEYEPKYSFLYENVMNERLLAYLVRRGYRQIEKADGLGFPTLIHASCWHYKDNG